jgi:alpha-mannosidase
LAAFQVITYGRVWVSTEEKGNDFILRGYETHGKSESIRLRLSLPLRGARFADLLEQAGRPVSVHDGAIEFKCRPFEFVTLRLSTSTSIQ